VNIALNVVVTIVPAVILGMFALNALATAGLVIVGLIALGALFTWVLIRSYRNLVKRISSSVPSLLFNELKQDIESGDYERRMQEPVSLSGMDRIYGPQIQADFPELNLDELKNRAEQMARTTLTAIDSENPGVLSESSELFVAQVKAYLDKLRDVGQKEHFSEMTTHRTVISRYVKQSGTCRIQFQLAMSASYQKTDAKGKTIEGHDGITQFKFELEALYVQDLGQLESQSISALAFNCPNCGAPVPSLGDKACKYCGSAIDPLNIRVWTFSGFDINDFKSGAFFSR